MHQPPGVGVGNQDVARLELGRHGANARDIVHRVAAHFELKAAVALGAVSLDAMRHHLGRFLRNRSIKGEVVTIAPSQEHAHRLPGGLAEDIPASHIDGGLDVRVALQGGVHAAVEPAELPRVFAQEVRPELGDARSRTGRVGRQVERPERTDFAVPGEPFVGLDRHDRAVENRDGFPPRPLVAPLVQR